MAASVSRTPVRLREPDALFGQVTCESTAFGRSTGSPRRPGCWTPFEWRRQGAGAFLGSFMVRRKRLTIDVDATLITPHFEQEKAAGDYTHARAGFIRWDGEG